MDNAFYKIVSIVSVRIKIFVGVIKMSADVEHAIDLKRNCISLNTLNAKEYKHIGEGQNLKDINGAFIMMKGTARSSIYISFKIVQL